MKLREKKTLVDQAKDYVGGTVRPQLESALDAGLDFAQHTALPALADARDKAVETAGPVLADARDKAGPKLADARDAVMDKAKPYVAQGSALAASKADDVRSLAASKAGDARSLAASKAGDARSLAETKVAELKGEKPKGKRRVRKLVLIAVVGGGAVFVLKKIQGPKAADAWQSSYTPTPVPTPANTDTASPTASTSAPATPAPVSDVATDAEVVPPTPAAPQAGLDESQAVQADVEDPQV